MILITMTRKKRRRILSYRQKQLKIDEEKYDEIFKTISNMNDAFKCG